MNNNELQLLKEAIKGLKYYPNSDMPIGINELKNLGLVYSNIQPNGITGFLPKAASSVSMLASIIHRQEKFYHRGAEFGSLRKELANIIISLFGIEQDNITINDLIYIKNKLSTWFTEKSVCRKHYIPCSIIPYNTDSFSVGPVRFVHVQQFWAERPNQNSFFDFQYEEFIRALQERHGCWIAIVEITGAEAKRSSELADLSVDIALCGLHFVLPDDVSQRMARINGRTWPAWSCRLSSTSFDFNNSQPGLTILPDTFNQLISLQQDVLDSVGRRINCFLDIKNPMSRLEQSWCDAGYWFHEALAEPLDTISIAKYETTIEILLAAGSSKQSGTRIRLAFLTLLGLEDDDVLIDGTSITVKSFSKTLVEARSRVLHGTWSTLLNEMSLNRQDVATIAFLFLKAFTLYLDEFWNENSKTNDDTVEIFFNWILSKRFSE